MYKYKKTVTVGLIGLGNQGMIHYKSLYKLEQSNKLKIVGVCDSRISLSVGVKHTFYRNYKELLSLTRPDIAIICVPNFLHNKIVVECLKLGINVIKEKPLSVDYKSAVDMVLRAKKSGLSIATMQQRRYNPLFMKAKEVIRFLGKPKDLFYQITVNDKKNSWYWDIKKSGGGSWLNIGWHSINMLHWLIGEVEHINLVWNINGKRRWNYSTDHSAFADVSFKGGCRGSIFVSCVYPKEEYLKINFSRGTLLLTKKELKIRSVSFNRIFTLENDDCMAYERQLEDLLSKVKKGIYDMEEDLKIMSIIQKGMDSLRINKDTFCQKDGDGQQYQQEYYI